MVMNKTCDKCKTSKPLLGGMQIGKSIGARAALCFVCADCLDLHQAKRRANGIPINHAEEDRK